MQQTYTHVIEILNGNKVAHVVKLSAGTTKQAERKFSREVTNDLTKKKREYPEAKEGFTLKIWSVEAYNKK